MSAIDRIKQYGRPVRARDDFQMLVPAEVVLTNEKIGKPAPYDPIEEYELRLLVATHYRAEPKFLQPARKLALRRLVDFLYRDQLRHLNDIRAAIYAGDRELALKHCDRLEDSISKEDV